MQRPGWGGPWTLICSPSKRRLRPCRPDVQMHWSGLPGYLSSCPWHWATKTMVFSHNHSPVQPWNWPSANTAGRTTSWSCQWTSCLVNKMLHDSGKPKSAVVRYQKQKISAHWSGSVCTLGCFKCTAQFLDEQHTSVFLEMTNQRRRLINCQVLNTVNIPMMKHQNLLDINYHETCQHLF